MGVDSGKQPIGGFGKRKEINRKGKTVKLRSPGVSCCFGFDDLPIWRIQLLLAFDLLLASSIHSLTCTIIALSCIHALCECEWFKEGQAKESSGGDEGRGETAQDGMRTELRYLSLKLSAHVETRVNFLHSSTLLLLVPETSL